MVLNDGAATGRTRKGRVRFNMGMPRPIVQNTLEAMAATPETVAMPTYHIAQHITCIFVILAIH